MANEREFDVVLEPQSEGGYTVYVPDLPGCVSEGDTVGGSGGDDPRRDERVFGIAS